MQHVTSCFIIVIILKYDTLINTILQVTCVKKKLIPPGEISLEI